MATSRVELPGSHRPPPAGERLGPTPPREAISVSVYLKDRDDDPLLALPPQPGGARPAATPRADLAADRHRDGVDDLAAVTDFARQQGLTVAGHDAVRRVVTLSGPVAAMEAAFGTSLSDYADGDARFRGRSGVLCLPDTVVGAIGAVLGLDTRPVATPKLRRVDSAAAKSAAATGFLPNAVGPIYDFPRGKTVGAGQTIAIIELGGGFLDSDTAKSFKAMKLPPPTVTAVGVSGGVNSPGGSDADGEVALDIQVAGGVAPGAHIAVYFAPNTSQGFVDAISSAVHDPVNKPSVISISWGSPESNWTAQALAAMTTALKDAATLGVTVFAASGDNLATDGAKDGKAHVDFPASSPYVVGCGGTLLRANGGNRSAESVWNSHGGGTGGGVSASFARPAYQAKAKVPKGSKGGGRGVPDVAGDADPASGYLVVVGGKTEQIGGTSAVAPLWAGLVAAINAVASAPVGFAHPRLYGNPAGFNDIVEGDNKVGRVGYAAKAGWDPCTGLGTPIGGALLALFKG